MVKDIWLNRSDRETLALMFLGNASRPEIEEVFPDDKTVRVGLSLMGMLAEIVIQDDKRTVKDVQTMGRKKIELIGYSCTRQFYGPEKVSDHFASAIFADSVLNWRSGSFRKDTPDIDSISRTIFFLYQIIRERGAGDEASLDDTWLLETDRLSRGKSKIW